MSTSFKEKAEHPGAYIDVRPSTFHVFILMQAADLFISFLVKM
jgi:hypothetical protein